MNKVTTTTSPRILNAAEAVEQLPGTLLKVFMAPQFHKSGGKIIMRTDSYDRPFITLQDGNLWGTAIAHYEFEIIESAKIES